MGDAQYNSARSCDEKFEIKGTSSQRSGKGAIRKRFPLQTPRRGKTN